MLVSLDEFDGRQALDREIASVVALLRDLRFLREGRHPNVLEMGEAAHLTNWRLALRPVACLQGTARGHPQVLDDRRIATSPIVAISSKLGFARTQNRFYVLERAVRGRADA